MEKQFQSNEAIFNMEMQSTTQLTSGKELDESNLPPCGGSVGKLMKSIRHRVCNLVEVNTNIQGIIRKSSVIVVLLAYLLYVLARWFKSDCSDIDWSNGFGFLFILYSLLGTSLLYYFVIKPSYLLFIDSLDDKKLKVFKTIVRWCYYVFLGVMVIIFLYTSCMDAVNEPRRYLSLAGYFVLIFIAFVFSKHPDYVRWDIIARGLCLHMTMALVLVKWKPGRQVLIVFSDKVIDFLEFSYAGARFVYGDYLIDLGVFLFKSLSVLFFLAMIINVLFYYGTLQSMFRNLGHLMQLLIGTTIIESSNSVASVFLGMSESPLLFKPYFAELTSSEIHAVMTSGFATVAGTVLAAYVSFGADPTTLVSASAMAAPASLTLAKLFYPENKRSRTSVKNLVLHKSEDANAIDAACKGALLGSEIVPAIAANVLSFVSLITCFNAVLFWMGRLAGIHDLSFEKLVGLLFVPLAWIMGVQPSQVFDVARLIGIKTVVNEFVGYKEMGRLVLLKQLSARSQAIATFAMCGFANPASVAILVSSLVTVSPEKRDVITKVAFRAFVAGSFASFLSASLAGFLTPEDGFDAVMIQSGGNSTVNATACYYFSW